MEDGLIDSLRTHPDKEVRRDIAMYLATTEATDEVVAELVSMARGGVKDPTSRNVMNVLRGKSLVYGDSDAVIGIKALGVTEREGVLNYLEWLYEEEVDIVHRDIFSEMHAAGKTIDSHALDYEPPVWDEVHYTYPNAPPGLQEALNFSFNVYGRGGAQIETVHKQIPSKNEAHVVMGEAIANLKSALGYDEVPPSDDEAPATTVGRELTKLEYAAALTIVGVSVALRFLPAAFVGYHLLKKEKTA